MSENKKDLVLENGLKGDSTNKVDGKVNESAYVKCTELTAEQVKEFPLYPVEIVKNESTYNGVKRVNTSLTLKIHKEFNLTLAGKNFTIHDFHLLMNSIFVKKFKMQDGLNSYTKKFPCRFVKGKRITSEGEEKDYYCCQVIMSKGKAYSLFINKADRTLELLETLVDCGKIEKPNWIIKDLQAEKDEDGNDVYDFD